MLFRAAPSTSFGRSPSPASGEDPRRATLLRVPHPRSGGGGPSGGRWRAPIEPRRAFGPLPASAVRVHRAGPGPHGRRICHSIPTGCSRPIPRPAASRAGCTARSRTCRSSRRTATPIRAGTRRMRRSPIRRALFVKPDHYIFRMLYSQGVPLESLGIPRRDGGPVETDPRAVWRVFAAHWHLFRATPTRLWLEHSLESLFGITDRLSPVTADRSTTASPRASPSPSSGPARSTAASASRQQGGQRGGEAECRGEAVDRGGIGTRGDHPAQGGCGKDAHHPTIPVAGCIMPILSRRWGTGSRRIPRSRPRLRRSGSGSGD